VSEIDSLLDRYQPGENEYVDRVRKEFLKMKEILQEEDEFQLLEGAEKAINDSVNEMPPLSEPDSIMATLETTRRNVLEKDPNSLNKDVKLQDKSLSMVNKVNYFTLLIVVALGCAISLVAFKLLKLRRR
jgi:hypothetical protein